MVQIWWLISIIPVHRRLSKRFIQATWKDPNSRKIMENIIEMIPLLIYLKKDSNCFFICSLYGNILQFINFRSTRASWKFYGPTPSLYLTNNVLLHQIPRPSSLHSTSCLKNIEKNKCIKVDSLNKNTSHKRKLLC